MDANSIIDSTALFIIGLAAYTSLISFRDNYPINLKFFSILWIIVFLVEVAGRIISLDSDSNFWLYNLLDIVLFLSIPFVFKDEFEGKIIKKIIWAFLGVFPIFVIVNYFIQDEKEFHTYKFIFGGIFMVFLSGAYLWQLYKSESETPLVKEPFFWLSLGILIYYGGYTPFLGMYNYLTKNFPDLTKSYFYVAMGLSMLLNLSIITGYLCRTRSR